MKKCYLLVVSALLLTACSPHDDGVFTLYSNQLDNASARRLVATFNADWGLNSKDFNLAYCNKVAKLLQEEWQEIIEKQKDLARLMQLKYWCEKGNFRK